MPTGIERSMSSDGRSGMSMRKGGREQRSTRLTNNRGARGARREVYIKDRKHIEEAGNIKKLGDGHEATGECGARGCDWWTGDGQLSTKCKEKCKGERSEHFLAKRENVKKNCIATAARVMTLHRHGAKPIRDADFTPSGSAFSRLGPRRGRS